MQRAVKISDPSLRDGSHAIQHQLDPSQITAYASAMDQSGVQYIEVGHGNGLGASSFQVGKSKFSDRQMLLAAREAIVNSRLSVHAIPGFASIHKDIIPALEVGVDCFRIASHCTEADTTQRHLTFLAEKDVEVIGVLMMTHTVSKEKLLESALLMQSYGASAIILMDSAGAYLPKQVTEKVEFLVNQLTIDVGFHAHNNLGLAVANSLAAVEAGATIIDATSRGFGAGAGNCQLEIIVPLLNKLGYTLDVNQERLFAAAELAEELLIQKLPFPKKMSIITGLAGIFSGFAKPLEHFANKYCIDIQELAFELGRRGVIAGQEDMIVEVAKALCEKDEKSTR